MWGTEEICSRCEEQFSVVEDKIFVNESSYSDSKIFYHFYTRCPECGKVTEIPEYMISESAKARILARYSRKIA